MATNVTVVDSAFRRATIKVSPGTYMTDVLEQACKKFNFEPSKYGLKNNNKPVNLSSPFRQTGLVAGAKLELVVTSRSPSAVTVALQLPDSLAATVSSGRLVDKFASDTTLWKILRHFESKDGRNLNFTGRGVTQLENGASGAGRIFYEMPTLNIMGRDVSDFGSLQKTLAQLGFRDGSVAVRLGFKSTELPLEQAMKEIDQYFEPVPESTETSKEVETVTDALAKLPSHEPEPSGNAEMANIAVASNKSLSAPTVEEATPTPLTPSKRPAPDSCDNAPALRGPDNRPIAVFSAPTGNTPRAALQPHNEADFEPTVAHAKLHQTRLQGSSVNKRLPSDAEQEQLEKDKAAKLAKVTSVRIKIRFPDQSVVESPFQAAETGADLYAYVTRVIAAKDQPYKLVYHDKGPQTVPNSEKQLIRDLGFSGAVLVNFLWEDAASDEARKGSVLEASFKNAAKPIYIPEAAPEEPEEAGRAPIADKGKDKQMHGKDKNKNGVPLWLMKSLTKK
ncbi:hypothetical protein B2J93_4630 [Marssonina coronariae]|uniref:UBX domain-containing protein n=1 Tax=Diplocarpon coronariae TaxID=2795749 RepID=A0A218Z2U7_9HELO|nr:hypothetical protein B2J93_4630 [Marssonina coronariae]